MEDVIHFDVVCYFIYLFTRISIDIDDEIFSFGKMINYHNGGLVTPVLPGNV